MFGDDSQETVLGRRNWGSDARDGVLLVTGVGLLIFESVIQLIGQSPNTTIVGAALAILIGAQVAKGNGGGGGA